MNSKQKLHQIKLTQWASRFQEQAASGLTVKAWCAENNVTIHTYNYWKHKLKLEYVDSLLPAEHDIVALTPDLLQTCPNNTPVFCQLHDSLKSHDLHEHNTLSITCGDINISVGPTISEEKLLLHAVLPKASFFHGNHLAFRITQSKNERKKDTVLPEQNAQISRCLSD